MRNWLIRLLGGYTLDEYHRASANALAKGVAEGKRQSHKVAVDALTRAYEIELMVMDADHKNGEHRYIGVATKAVDSFRRNVQARLREEFGVEDNPETEDAAYEKWKETASAQPGISATPQNVLRAMNREQLAGAVNAYGIHQPLDMENAAPKYTNGVAQ